MGRKKILKEQKRKNLFLSIEKDLFEKFEELNIKNKSKFFNWLLEEHFNSLEGGRDDIN